MNNIIKILTLSASLGMLSGCSMDASSSPYNLSYNLNRLSTSISQSDHIAEKNFFMKDHYNYEKNNLSSKTIENENLLTEEDDDLENYSAYKDRKYRYGNVEKYSKQSGDYGYYSPRYYESMQSLADSDVFSEQIAKLDTLFNVSQDVLAANEKYETLKSDLEQSIENTQASLDKIKNNEIELSSQQLLALKEYAKAIRTSTGVLNNTRGVIKRSSRNLSNLKADLVENCDVLSAKYFNMLNCIDDRITAMENAISSITMINGILQADYSNNNTQQNNETEMQNTVENNLGLVKRQDTSIIENNSSNDNSQNQNTSEDMKKVDENATDLDTQKDTSSNQTEIIATENNLESKNQTEKSSEIFIDKSTIEEVESNKIICEDENCVQTECKDGKCTVEKNDNTTNTNTDTDENQPIENDAVAKDKDKDKDKDNELKTNEAKTETSENKKLNIDTYQSNDIEPNINEYAPEYSNIDTMIGGYGSGIGGMGGGTMIGQNSGFGLADNYGTSNAPESTPYYQKNNLADGENNDNHIDKEEIKNEIKEDIKQEIKNEENQNQNTVDKQNSNNNSTSNKTETKTSTNKTTNKQRKSNIDTYQKQPTLSIAPPPEVLEKEPKIEYLPSYLIDENNWPEKKVFA